MDLTVDTITPLFPFLLYLCHIMVWSTDLSCIGFNFQRSAEKKTDLVKCKVLEFRKISPSKFVIPEISGVLRRHIVDDHRHVVSQLHRN